MGNGAICFLEFAWNVPFQRNLFSQTHSSGGDGVGFGYILKGIPWKVLFCKETSFHQPPLGGKICCVKSKNSSNCVKYPELERHLFQETVPRGHCNIVFLTITWNFQMCKEPYIWQDPKGSGENFLEIEWKVHICAETSLMPFPPHQGEELWKVGFLVNLYMSCNWQKITNNTPCPAGGSVKGRFFCICGNFMQFSEKISIKHRRCTATIVV